MEGLCNGESGESLRIMEIEKPSLVELIECDFDGMKVEHVSKRRDRKTTVEAMSDSFVTEHHLSPFIGIEIECGTLLCLKILE